MMKLRTLGAIPCLVTVLLQINMAATFSVSTGAGRTKTALSISFSSHSTDDSPEEANPNRLAEFIDLEPIRESSIRKARMKKDREIDNQFVTFGDDLWRLRTTADKLSRKLVDAINDGCYEREKQIRAQLREVEQQDPELVYSLELKALQEAKADGRMEDAESHGAKAMAARSCLPAHNLEGLWVGKYGHNGYEMINVTYQGDHLIAYKVTGDKNVPKGEITFQVNLSPLQPKRVGSDGSPQSDQRLQPIKLTEKAANKWGTTQLPRYRGLGQVAEPGFTNRQWMDAQLIIIGEDYFSFAWVPIETQIFFGRPSPELALKMMRKSGSTSSFGLKTWSNPPSMNDEVEVLKEYVSSCLARTAETVEEDFHGDPFTCIWHGVDTEECYFQ
eukprot:scaffold2817_cov130-Cylindrotheca_fusiformis.AAC.18